HEAHEDARPARLRLELFLHEVFEPFYFDRIFKSFRDGISAKPRNGERKPGEKKNLWEKYWIVLKYLKAFIAFWSTWFTYRKKLGTPYGKAAEMWPQPYNAFSADGGEHARSVLALRFGWADVLAVRYADATRSAHIAIAMLGAL